MLASRQSFIACSAFLLAAFPAFAGETTPGVAPVAVPTAVVKCPGVTNIPFTADPEQALPLRVVGALRCGETVAVLSDIEGYTDLIRTQDGQLGYVARMYLSTDASTPVTVRKEHSTSARPVNGIVRWAAGAPGCDEFLSHGRHVESVTANGITVQVSLQDSGWKYRANVAISNQSSTPAEVLPGIITLDELIPNLRPLPAVNAEKVARNPNHQVLWTLANAIPSPSAVGNFSAANSLSDRLSNRTSPAPDYLDPHLALASTRHGALDRTETVDLQALSLKPTSLSSGQLTAGVMFFERDNAAHELSLRVPVGDMVFDFAFSFDQKK